MTGRGLVRMVDSNHGSLTKVITAVRLVVVTTVLLGCLGQTASAIGPFELSDSEKGTTLRLQLASQLQTFWESRDGGEIGERESNLVMKVRRVRPVLRLSLPDYQTTFKLHLNLAPGAVELMDLQFNAVLKPQVQLRVGQYKIPFTRYRIQSFQRLTFVDWSLVTRYFGAERQMGFSIHNGYEKPPRLGYVFGVFNGVNARASHATGLALLFGEKIVNRSDLSQSTGPAEFHPELVGHFSYNSAGIDVRTDSDSERGPLRYTFASSAAWDIKPQRYEELALRVAQEFLVKYHGWSLMSAVYAGFTAVDNSQRTRLAFSGLLVQSAYRMSNRVELSAKYAAVGIEGTLADQAYTRGQAFIAVTTDPAVIVQYKRAGMLRSAREGTIGINVYLDGHSFKWQNDFGFATTECRDQDLTDYTIRSQIQLAF